MSKPGHRLEVVHVASAPGEDARVLDPSDALGDWPERVGWNPLDSVSSWDDAQSLARIMVEAGDSRMRINETFWTEVAIGILSPYLYAGAKSQASMADVIRWVQQRAEPEVLAEIEAVGDENALNTAKSRWNTIEASKANGYITLGVAIAVWQLDKVQNLSAAESTFSFSKFFNRESNTLYVCAPPEAQREYQAFFTLLLRLLLREAYASNRGFASSLLGLRGPIAAIEASQGSVSPLLLVLDDAGSIGSIPDLGGVISTAAKAAIQLVTVFTDLSQMRAIYGEDSTRTMVNNHSTIMVFPGSHDPQTSELVEHLLAGGESRGSGGERLTSEAVRRLPWGKALCVTGNLVPEVVDLRSSMTTPQLLELRGLDASY